MITENTTSNKFLIESELLDKLRPEMVKAADKIRKAIAESRLIILKHHADCDGYIGGIAIEFAIKPLVAKKHRSVWHYFKRTPSKAPYYDYQDCLKDLHAGSGEIKEGRKPLIIIVDNGSTKEDLLALKRIRQLGFESIVVDHHKPTFKDGKAVVQEHTDIFINPYLVGGDSNLTAGMLGVELAKIISKLDNIEHLPAISGITDKAQSVEFEKYIELAKSKGFSVEHLTKLGRCIDFEAFYIGFFDSSVISDVLLMRLEEQKKYVELISSEMEKRVDNIIQSAQKYLKMTDAGKFEIIEVEISGLLSRGTFPPSGKSTGMIFNYMSEKREKPMIMLGKGEDYITMRSNISGFDLNKMIAELVEKLPHSRAEGGGHELAGTVKFAAVAKQEVLDFLKKYLNDNHGAN